MHITKIAFVKGCDRFIVDSLYLFTGQTTGTENKKGSLKQAISPRSVRKMIQVVRAKAAKKHGDPNLYSISSPSERYSDTAWAIGHWHEHWKIPETISMVTLDHKSAKSYTRRAGLKNNSA